MSSLRPHPDPLETASHLGSQDLKMAMAPIEPLKGLEETNQRSSFELLALRRNIEKLLSRRCG